MLSETSAVVKTQPMWVSTFSVSLVLSFLKKIAGPSEQSPSHHQNYSVHIFYVAFIQNKEINFKD